MTAVDTCRTQCWLQAVNGWYLSYTLSIAGTPQPTSCKLWLLHCVLSLAVQCIVIGPVCGFVCVTVCRCVSLLPW